MSGIVPAPAPRGLLQGLLAPSLLDVFFGALLLAAFAHPQGLRSLLSDGDTGWHIRTGELVLATGRAPVADPFSFTRPRQPWFAWEWLADVVFAIAWRWRGLAGVAALTGALLALAATALLARILRRGCGLWIGLGATMAAVSASSVHYLARPHVFSILIYTLALWILAEDRRRRGPLLWMLVPLTALWVNLHAGFVAWLATLGLLSMFCAAGRDRSGVRRYGGLAALCSLASFLNPYGWQLHLHIARYLNSSWIMDHVQEFQSPHIRSEGMIVFALLLLATVALAPRGDRFEAWLVLVWGFLALRSARHVPFFAIAAAPVLASAGAAYWARLAAFADRRSPLRLCWELAQEFGRHPRATLWLPLSAAVVMLAVPAVGFPDTVFPVQAVERNLQQLTPPAAMPRILTSDQWADYLIYRLYPEQRVFFDGRSDFFGPAVGSDYRKLLAGERPWRELLDRYQFDLALLPHDWALSTALEREPQWRRVYRDSVAVLYARVPLGPLPGSEGSLIPIAPAGGGAGRERDLGHHVGITSHVLPWRTHWPTGHPVPRRVSTRRLRALGSGRRQECRRCTGCPLGQRVRHICQSAQCEVMVAVALRRETVYSEAPGEGTLPTAGAAGRLACAAWGGWHGPGIGAPGTLLCNPRTAAIRYPPAIVVEAWDGLLGGGS